MISLLAAPGDTSFWGQYGIWFVLIVLLIGLMVFSTIRRRKYDGQVQNMIDNLKVGDAVKTYSGFYGKIVSIRQTTDGKVVLIEMGEGNRKGYIEADINAIMCIDKKEDVVYDSDGNIVMPNSEEKAPTAPITSQEEQNEERVSTADKLRAKKDKKKSKKEEQTIEAVEQKETTEEQPKEEVVDLDEKKE